MLKERIEKFDDNYAGIIIQKDEKIMYEQYFNGYHEKEPIHIFSITKSILSSLIGIAIDQGYINSIDQNILEFFPEYNGIQNNPVMQEITLRHLLTMTAPYQPEPTSYIDYFMSPDKVAYALNALGGNDPIGHFRYTPLIGPDILSGILVKATGESVLSYARKYLFDPLQIKVEKSLIFHNEEEQLAFYGARNLSAWVSDAKGTHMAGWGLTLTPRDMLTIGSLYLHKGNYQGKQIVSKTWIEDSIRIQSKWNDLSYGYLWWVDIEGGFAAMGDGGNMIYCHPQHHLVIVIASTFKPEANDRINLLKSILPLLQ